MDDHGQGCVAWFNVAGVSAPARAEQWPGMSRDDPLPAQTSHERLPGPSLVQAASLSSMERARWGPAACHEAIWMQTTGTALLTINRCSIARVWTPAHDGRSAHGLLYPAAVRGDGRKPEHRRHSDQYLANGDIIDRPADTPQAADPHPPMLRTQGSESPVMRKQHSTYLASAALVLWLTACGSSGSSHSAASSPAHSAATPAAPATSASSPSCNDQMTAWRETGLSELNAVGSAVSQLGSDTTALALAMSSGGDETTAQANMQADAAKLQSAIQVAQADLPPDCIPGFRSAVSAGLSDYNTYAIDSSNAASAAASGNYGLASGDIKAANTALMQGNSKIKSATAILDQFQGTS